MSAKVQTVESFEAVCFVCDWYGEEHDDDVAAQADVERHNAECHGPVRWGLTWSGRKHVSTGERSTIRGLESQEIAACNGSTYVYPLAGVGLPPHLRVLVDPPVCKRCVKIAAKGGAS